MKNLHHQNAQQFSQESRWYSTSGRHGKDCLHSRNLTVNLDEALQQGYKLFRRNSPRSQLNIDILLCI